MGKDVHSNTGMCPWPVGSHLFNDGQNPGEIWGGTTWEQIKEKFPLGCGDTHAAGTSGGEFEHKLTVSETPSHSHQQNGQTSDGHTNGVVNTKIAGNYYGAYIQYGYYGSGTRAAQMMTSSAGGNQPHNITPPYLAIYWWHRIA